MGRIGWKDRSVGRIGWKDRTVGEDRVEGPDCGGG